MKKETGEKLICQNKKASYDFHLEKRFEAGIVLRGTEVKSLRMGKGSLGDSYADVYGGEVYLHHFHITEYSHGGKLNHEPLRKRKLLLHKEEIQKLDGTIKKAGYTLVPTKVYFKNGKVKVEIALARGKTKGDKRESIKKKDAEREIRRNARG